MRFAQPMWLLGTGCAALVAVVLVIGGILTVRALQRFGDEVRVRALLSDNSSGMRALKGALLVVAVAFGFVALAQPQYGRGTRTIPATDLDVVIALDFSKSMYARDISPSRIDRAKAEVGRLIARLPGARFGAVAFAGEPMGFPLTSDGAAIAQFFRQLQPNDMPVGGTAIARALESARELLARDPKSPTHKRVIVLITDGEDLAGDPVEAAKSASSENVVVHVVQIGGRTPEPIPDVDGTGDVVGWRTDATGAPLTTALSAEGEAQLAKVAEVAGGRVARSGEGKTGIEIISAELGRMMKHELAETVETIYADVYYYPLALTILLLILETFVPEARLRKRRGAAPRTVAAATTTLLLLTGCSEQFDKLFERRAPAVDEALSHFDAGRPADAVRLLESYLSTGSCKDGSIGTPAQVGKRPEAAFDLGLGLFSLAEQFGQRFGADEPPGGEPKLSDEQAAERGSRIDCALLVTSTLGTDHSLSPELRARAHFLAGNLRMLRGEYKNAVEEYDAALKLVPGLPEDAGTSVGRDAAHNRSIALRRIQEEQPPDGGSPDAGGDDGGSPDAGGDDGGSPDAGSEDGGSPDAGGDDGGSPDPSSPDAGAQTPDTGEEDRQDQRPSPQDPQSKGAPDEPEHKAPPPTASQDERILDILEQAPTLQEHSARQRGARAVYPDMEDK